MIEATMPFVLLDDASETGSARLYSNPVEIVTTDKPDELPRCLERLREAGREGLHAAGYLSYEAGLWLEPRLRAAAPAPSELLWFGLFPEVETFPSAALPSRLPDPAGAWVGRPQPLISQRDYDDALARVKEWIAAGDIYQANLTFQAEVPLLGNPLAVYAKLRTAGGGRWSGTVFTGKSWLLSLSPELFFTLENGKLTARPMKGTAARRRDRAGDRNAAAELGSDTKQRAENLMIVDLLRNDLSRVSLAGSVAVPELFTVETYPTVHQMTSTVTARIEPGHDALDVIARIFPCGSVTGAPKIRAMEIIAEVERFARGPYTGSIGRIDPGGDAAFNVAIRTLVLHEGEARATLGLGSGIVADSNSGDEWRECLAKGAFVKASDRPFDLIETMRFDDHDGIADLDRHIARMKASAEALGFEFDRHEIRNELQAATFRLREERRIRLMLSRSGAVAIESRPLPPKPNMPVPVAVAKRPGAADDFRLRHKTTDRGFYDAARAASGAFEVVFEDEQGFLTEGSFTSIFVEREGKLVTPPLGRGLLPGVLRARLIDQKRAIEGDLRPEDLEPGFFIGNAVRGLIPARLVAAKAGSGL